MFTYAIACSAVLAVLVAVQFAEILAYVRTMRPLPPTETDDASLPKFSILMPLRGADPFLSAAINSVLDQDYPRFELHIIIDHPDDPAWAAVQEVLDCRPGQNVRVSVLEDKPETCSLICSAVRQFIRTLDDETELVIVCAADMVVPRNWLKEAAIVLRDPNVGATLGNRWYMPRDARLGSLVRYVWNSGANVSMWRYQGVWSGTMALRVSDIHRVNLPEIWGRAMVEDMTVAEPLLKAGLELRHVPQLLVVNREETTVAGNYRFIRRQMLFTQLYHPRGFHMTLRWVPMSIAGVTAIASFVAALFLNEYRAATVLGTTLVASALMLFSGLSWMEYRVRRKMRARGEETSPIRISSFFLMPIALVISQVQYLAVLIDCLFTRRVVWRGITYRLKSPYDVRMDGYQAFQQHSETTRQGISV